MVGDILQPTHLLFVLVVALLVLGPKRLPEVGRTLGSGMRDFRQAISGESNDHHDHHEPEQVRHTESNEQRHQVETEPESDVWVHTESTTDSPHFTSDSTVDSTSSTTASAEPTESPAAAPDPAASEPAADQPEHHAAESETQRPS